MADSPEECVSTEEVNCELFFNTTTTTASALLTATECHPKSSDLIRMYLYMIVGSISACISLLIFVVILTNKELHKTNFMLIAGLALGHFANGTSYIAAGASRFIMMQQCVENNIVAPFLCMKKEAANSLVVIGEAICGWLVFFFGVERLLACSVVGCLPAVKLTERSCAYVLAFVGCFAAFDVSAAILASYTQDQTPRVPNLCSLAYSVPEWYYVAHKSQMVTCGCAGCAIYAYVIAVMAYRRRRTVVSENVMAVRAKREWKLTKTLAVIICTTFIFQVLPIIIYLTGLKDNNFLKTNGSYVWTVYTANGAFDMIFYAVKMKSLGNAVLQFLGLRQRTEVKTTLVTSRTG